MSRLVIAAAVMLSFTASVRAAAPTVAATSVSGATSGVVTCPSRTCDIVHPSVRI